MTGTHTTILSAEGRSSHTVSIDIHCINLLTNVLFRQGQEHGSHRHRLLRRLWSDQPRFHSHRICRPGTGSGCRQGAAKCLNQFGMEFKSQSKSIVRGPSRFDGAIFLARTCCSPLCFSCSSFSENVVKNYAYLISVLNCNSALSLSALVLGIRSNSSHCHLKYVHKCICLHDPAAMKALSMLPITSPSVKAVVHSRAMLSMKVDANIKPCIAQQQRQEVTQK